ncbi:hypothetical protein M0G43_07985 [Subsaxibacter sp. CAU 1640]|uniref:hypothetical protein n=1 Tax=Subsaxibacter sp. CAU 1640 TaxID=2933271 RepID=UPI0020054DD8|nr:hypothetical protein [Subsaxibacter sp. CAU 1640]MCK7590507.1 hypothetical protein [Subsaxibacter sp. CAU 1640]
MKIKFVYIVLSLLVISNRLIGQNENQNVMSDEAYELINNLFDSKDDVGIYKLTDFSKTWMYLMSPNQLDNLMGPPCNDGNKLIKWSEIFSDEDFKSIIEKIINSTPLELDRKRLNAHITLEDSFEPIGKSYKTVSSISQPIIINNYAIIKRSGLKGESIIVAKKLNGTWKVVCHKTVFGISED